MKTIKKGQKFKLHKRLCDANFAVKLLIKQVKIINLTLMDCLTDEQAVKLLIKGKNYKS
jgi:hypothetical protein